VTKALAVAALAAVLTTFSCARSTPDTAGTQQAPIAEPTAQNLAMQRFAPIPGTPILYAALTEGREGRWESSADSYSGLPARNFVFLDQETLQSHMLFETNQQLVSELSQVGNPGNPSAPVLEKPAKTVRWLMFRVVRQDTDNDKRLDDDDLFAVGFTDAAGKNYSDVIPRVERILGTGVVSEDRVTLAYVIDGRALASLIDIPSRSIVGTQDIAGYPVAP